MAKLQTSTTPQTFTVQQVDQLVALYETKLRKMQAELHRLRTHAAQAPKLQAYRAPDTLCRVVQQQKAQGMRS